MKKTYINPELEIVKIASQTQMLAGSPVPQVLDKDVTPISDGGDIGGREDEYDW